MRPSHVCEALHHLVRIRQPVFLWGPPGVGKSRLVADVARRQGRKLYDLRAVLLDPVDLRGLPRISDEGITSWCVTEFLPHPQDTEKGILFLDELNAAPPLVQAACYQLILDRRVGQYRLPDGWAVVAAGNRESDRAVTYRMPSALANRMVHLDVECHIDDWLDWARANGIRAVFLGAGTVGMGYPAFAVDTRREMRQLTNRLFSLGHTEIALLCGVHRYCATELRHRGYLDAFREHGREADPEMMLCDEYSTRSFLHFVERKRPTALACIDGLLATRALNDLIRHGVHVPDEISILAITGIDVPPSILTIGRFTEPEGISEQNALEFLFSGKCSAPLTEDGLQLKLESVYHPGETEAPPPRKIPRYRNLQTNDIFRKTSA